MLYTDHLSNLCLEWEPPVPSRDPTLPVCKEEEEEGDSGRIRWQCNARAGPVFTFTLLEVGNCKCRGELAFREALLDGAGFGGSHVLRSLLACRGCYFCIEFIVRLLHDSHQHRAGVQVHYPQGKLSRLAVCWLCLAM